MHQAAQCCCHRCCLPPSPPASSGLGGPAAAAATAFVGTSFSLLSAHSACRDRHKSSPQAVAAGLHRGRRELGTESRSRLCS